MTVDSEAIFALVEHESNRAKALEKLYGSMATAWVDEREPDVVFLARGIGRPLWIGEGRHELFFASTREAIELVERYAGVRLRAREVPEGPSARARRRARRPPRGLRARSDLHREAPLPAVRAPEERPLLPRAARRARRRHPRPVASSPARRFRPPRPPRAALRTATESAPTRRACRRRAGRPATRSELRVAAARLRPVVEARQAPSRARRRTPCSTARSSRSSPRGRRSRPPGARSRASRTCASRATSRASRRRALAQVARRRRPPELLAERRGAGRGAPHGSRTAAARGPRRLAAFQVPKCSMTVCGWTRVRRSRTNSRIVGERPSRSAHALSGQDLVVGVARRSRANWPAPSSAESICTGSHGVAAKRIEQARRSAIRATTQSAPEALELRGAGCPSRLGLELALEQALERRDAARAELAARSAAELVERLVGRAAAR